MVGCCSGPGGGGGGASSSGRKRTYRGWGSRSPQKGFIKEGKALAWRRPRDFCLPRGCAQRLQAWKSLFCTNTSVPAIQRSCRRLLMPAAATPGPPPPLRRRLGAAWPIRQRPSFPVCSQQPLRSLSCPQRPWTPRPLRPWGEVLSWPASAATLCRGHTHSAFSGRWHRPASSKARRRCHRTATAPPLSRLTYRHLSAHGQQA